MDFLHYSEYNEEVTAVMTLQPWQHLVFLLEDQIPRS